MRLNRNHYFLLGMILLLLGAQFRLVDSYVLNEKTTQFLAQRLQKSEGPSISRVPMLIAQAAGPAPRHTVRPPNWLGWALLSVGSVVVLQSLAMRKAG